ncbi:MAG TPA: hypothetical protein VGO43_05120 [Pyrinomonadaceae bacterium]|nr:hypothetical protein [Pyrinomonadaceae bacterium]
MFTKTAKNRSTMLIVLSALFLILFTHGRSEAQAPPNSTFCANDFQPCNFEGTREVIYGANGIFVRKVIKGGSVCLPATFGIDDPVPNVLKKCYVADVKPAAVTTQPTADPGRVKLSITVKNNSGMSIYARLVNRKLYSDPMNKADMVQAVGAQIQELQSGQAAQLGDKILDRPKEDLEFWIQQAGAYLKPIFKAQLPMTGDQLVLCYEITGTHFVPYIKPCVASDLTYESKYISLNNEAAFQSSMSLTYYPTDGSGPKKASTASTTAGSKTKLYLPLDADTRKQMVLTVDVDVSNRNLLTKNITEREFTSACYKVWGDAVYPKINPCSIDATARTIKFWNNSGYVASMSVTYFDKDGGGKDVSRSVTTNKLTVTQTESIEVPIGTSATPVKVSIYNNYTGNLISETPVKADFTGELCYKAEGASFAPTASTCDGTVGDTSGNTRQIRFQNDAGFDAQLIVTYFEDQTINGVKVPMPKTLTTGMINGLGGKFRLVTIPKKTAAGMPITIGIQGNATVKNDIFATTLPANFAASPQPCFKVWGTFLDPQGGKCDQ